MTRIRNITIVGILIGTILEWYDFSLLGSLASVISKLFFPSNSPTISLLATFGVFATGFIARPIGGLIFGHIGDKYGRKIALSWTIVAMALPTTLIGFLPTFQSVGAIASITLIILRFMQGLAASGEYPGAICVLSEMAPHKLKNFFTSLSMLGVVGGICLGSLVNSFLSYFLSSEQIQLWGWRIPFLLSAPLGLIGWYLRYKTPESEKFLSSLNNFNFIPIKELLKNNTTNLIKVILLFSLNTTAFYMGFVYVIGYLTSVNKITLHQGLIVNSISTITLALLIPLCGYLSDKINAKRVMLTGCIGLLIFLYPIFILFSYGKPLSLLIGQLSLSALIALFVGPLAAITADSFDTRIRYTGIAIGLNISATLFGGTCPLIATFILKATGNQIIPSIYPIFLAFICFILIKPKTIKIEKFIAYLVFIFKKIAVLERKESEPVQD